MAKVKIMSVKMQAATFRRPSYVMNAEGEAEAVLIDINTWKMILERLEDSVDHELLRQASADLETLSKGSRPPGWQSWDIFEDELDALEEAGELPG
jgi:hypothetical protein